jgi:hypothetical protein
MESKWRVAVAVSLVVSALAFSYYLTQRVPPGLESKGAEDISAVASLVTAVAGFVTAIAAAIVSLRKPKQ